MAERSNSDGWTHSVEEFIKEANERLCTHKYDCAPRGPAYNAEQIPHITKMLETPTDFGSVQKDLTSTKALQTKLRSVQREYQEYYSEWEGTSYWKPPNQLESIFAVMYVVLNALTERQQRLVEQRKLLGVLRKVVARQFNPTFLFKLWQSIAAAPRRANEARLKAERQELIARWDNEFVEFAVQVNNGTNRLPDRLLH